MHAHAHSIEASDQRTDRGELDGAAAATVSRNTHSLNLSAMILLQMGGYEVPCVRALSIAAAVCWHVRVSSSGESAALHSLSDL